LCILLAEDNAVNQRLATVNLETWGHRVVVARDGLEAVEAFSAQHFDLILMDSQMPRLGGFEATAEIRRREAGGGDGRHGLDGQHGRGAARVPIIAMTANVMKGYREECLAAGMDGYVAKPMRRHELIQAIAGVVPGFLVEGAAPAEPSILSMASMQSMPPASPDDAIFEPAALLESLGGNRTALAEMIRLCLEEDTPRLLADLHEGLETNDFTAIEYAAHGLKGLVGAFHAPSAQSAALHLEESARGHETESIPSRAHALEEELARLAEALRACAKT
jgi:CheY-like chemotaxis protein/HPt (histidine-containing phosphotransfer) domain-containing protein